MLIISTLFILEKIDSLLVLEVSVIGLPIILDIILIPF